MYASASTWLFNIVRQLHSAAQAGPVQTRFLSDGRMDLDVDQPDVTYILKSHELKDDDVVLKLARHAGNILITVRDPRDAVTSLMRYHGYEFEKALPHVESTTKLCMSFARDKRALLFNFEHGFYDDPATLRVLAEYLGYRVDERIRDEIFGAASRTAIEQHIAGLPNRQDVLRDPVSGDLLDPATHWHSHHAGRDGEIGRWKRMLTLAQAEIVKERLIAWYPFQLE